MQQAESYLNMNALVCSPAEN